MLDYLRRERCILSFGVLGFPGFIFGQRRGKGCLVRTVLTLDGGRGLKQPSSDVRWVGGRVESKYIGTLDSEKSRMDRGAGSGDQTVGRTTGFDFTPGEGHGDVVMAKQSLAK